VIRPLGPQAVGEREIAIEVAQVQPRWNRGQLMDHHLRPRPANGDRDLVGVERIRDHRHRAELSQHRPL
jgi:hypothetical protein